jgi:protein disulfide-isomerase A1
MHNRYKIEGFPTMHFFKYGKQIAYTGGNKQDSIVQWVRRHSMPSTTELATVEAVSAKQSMVPVMLVGYFPSSTETVDLGKKSFFQAAEFKDTLNFFHTNSAEVALHLGLESDGIAILKTFDEKHHVLHFSDYDSTDGGSDVANAVTEFVNSMTYPLISVFTKEKAREIFSPKIMVGFS